MKIFRRENTMTLTQWIKPAGAIAIFAAIVLATTLSSSRPARATDDDDNDRNESKVRIGFAIAPVPLNVQGKDHELVGLGSYIVNAQADCDGCHSAGPQTEFLPGGNPYFGEPEKINPATYLGGGRDFGPYPAENSALHIISRNLTPDKTGLPEGGRTFAEFLQIMRNGVDMDHLHPNCSVTLATNCLHLPFKGNLLQIMPWPVYKNMTDRDLRAIYEYLSAIPCIAGPEDPTDPLHNDCG
jgi:hypothetical protein